MDCLIQARYSSSRLRGKVLKKIENIEILKHVVNNVEKSKFIKNIYILTSYKDNKIHSFCKKNNYQFFKGPLTNTFLRYKKFLNLQKKINFFIRISGDSPLINYKIIDKMIKIFKKKKYYDLVTNINPRTFPKGQSVEIIKSESFLKIDSSKLSISEREHVTKYFYNNQKEFKIYNYRNNHDMSHYNLSIDTIKDFNLIKKIIKNNNSYNLKELVSLIKKFKI